MTWGDLFDRAADSETTVDAVRAALADRRGADGDEDEGRESDGTAGDGGDGA